MIEHYETPAKFMSLTELGETAEIAAMYNSNIFRATKQEDDL